MSADGAKRVLRALLWLARGLLAAVFFYSGVIKLGAGESFAVTILSFGILIPAWLGHGIAVTLPWGELLAAILLVLPRVYRVGAGMVACFCIVFISAIGWALSQGIVVDCGCFGESAPSFEKMWLAIWRDVFLLAVALFILFGSLRIPGIFRKTPASV